MPWLLIAAVVFVVYALSQSGALGGKQAGGRASLTRTCAGCGKQYHTQHTHCPHCGREAAPGEESRTCPGCGKPVSTRDPQCPHCSFPLRPKSSGNQVWRVCNKCRRQFRSHHPKCPYCGTLNAFPPTGPAGPEPPLEQHCPSCRRPFSGNLSRCPHCGRLPGPNRDQPAPRAGTPPKAQPVPQPAAPGGAPSQAAPPLQSVSPEEASPQAAPPLQSASPEEASPQAAPPLQSASPEEVSIQAASPEEVSPQAAPSLHPASSEEASPQDAPPLHPASPEEVSIQAVPLLEDSAGGVRLEYGDAAGQQRFSPAISLEDSLLEEVYRSGALAFEALYREAGGGDTQLSGTHWDFLQDPWQMMNIPVLLDSGGEASSKSSPG